MWEEVLQFWFEELSPKDWWVKSTELDTQIRQRFSELHQQASHNELFSWRSSAEGALAEIIVLDQFSRNIYRDSAEAFKHDSLALALALGAIDKHYDSELDSIQRSFMYLPLMHSESALIHEKAVELYQRLGDSEKLDFEFRHKAIIDRFGRYPHRNSVLGRESTEEELAFLKEPGSSF